jgi:hypothetical protein
MQRASIIQGEIGGQMTADPTGHGFEMNIIPFMSHKQAAAASLSPQMNSSSTRPTKPMSHNVQVH